MATIRGTKYFRWALTNFDMTGTGVGDFLPQSVNFEKQAKRVDIADAGGNTCGLVFHDFSNSVSAEVVVSSDTVAAIGTNNALPSIGAIITVVDTDDAEMAGATTTAYVLVGVSKQRSNTDVCKATFELYRSNDNNVAQTVS